ncbi:hypothetical protein UlMin_035230 [Ulmus minor]
MIHGLRFGRGGRRRGLTISHILFADDSFLFVDTNRLDGDELMEVLDYYKATSGQVVNLDKSEVCFGIDISEEDRASMADFLGVKQVECHEKYLKLPTFAGRCKKDSFAFFKNKVWNKLKSWNGFIFSMAGKKVLLKEVVQAVPTYVMSCFKLSKKLIKNLHMLIVDFWWGSKGGKSNMHCNK